MSELTQVITIDGKEYEYDHIFDKLIEIQKSNKDLEKDTFKDIWYPEPDIELWESFLNRELQKDEKELILDLIVEKELNQQINKLSKLLSEKNSFIPKLTNNNGNCLFESLSILGLGDNDLGIEPHVILRNNLSSMLLYVRDMIDFFPDLNMSPQQIFDNSNEIEFIKSKKTGEVFEYNYDMMVCDLRTNFSWTRLPTELILMTISRIYEVRILIYNNKNNYINEINVWKNQNSEIETIFLGHINEEHYVPVLEIPTYIDDIDTKMYIQEIINGDKLVYTNSKNKYEKWANFIALTIYDTGSTINDTGSTINDTGSNIVENPKPRIISPPKHYEPPEKINLNEFEII